MKFKIKINEIILFTKQKDLKKNNSKNIMKNKIKKYMQESLLK